MYCALPDFWDGPKKKLVQNQPSQFLVRNRHLLGIHRECDFSLKFTYPVELASKNRQKSRAPARGRKITLEKIKRATMTLPPRTLTNYFSKITETED
jgi:hypothetical protein